MMVLTLSHAAELLQLSSLVLKENKPQCTKKLQVVPANELISNALKVHLSHFRPFLCRGGLARVRKKTSLADLNATQKFLVERTRDELKLLKEMSVEGERPQRLSKGNFDLAFETAAPRAGWKKAQSGGDLRGWWNMSNFNQSLILNSHGDPNESIGEAFSRAFQLFSAKVVKEIGCALHDICKNDFTEILWFFVFKEKKKKII